jgi:hypothetical protein
MWSAPQGDSGGILSFSSDIVAVAGSSGLWAVWAQRDWEIGVLVAPDPVGPWLDQGIRFFDPDEDFSDLRSPPGWGMPLEPDELAVFRRNIHDLRHG